MIGAALVKGVVTVTDGLTFTTKLVLVLWGPSFTVTVIVVLPVCPVAGVTVTVRLAPPPPNTMFPIGTNIGLDEDALNCRLAAATSASSTVKLSGPVV